MGKSHKDQELTDKEKMFTLEYIKDFNAMRSAVAAGYTLNYSKANSYKIPRRPQVLAEINRLQAERVKQTAMDADEVVRRLTRIAQKAEHESRYNDAIRALELIGKHLQMFTDRSEIELTSRNPYASGNDAEAMLRDIKHLTKVLGGGKRLTDDEDTLH